MDYIRDDNYLIKHIDSAINELVVPQYRLQKAYNYYNGYRDPEQFRYLEENFGIGSPTSIEFTPLIRKHVDALIGEYLDIPLLPKITCKDEKTLSNIQRDKQLYINKEIYNFYKSKLTNQILAFIDGKNINDQYIEEALTKLIEELNNSFISEYEIASQNIIEYILQSKQIDLITKLKTLILDIFVSGRCFFKSKKLKNDLTLKVYSPLNTFVDRNPESNYVKDSYRAVIRTWKTKQQILNEYSELLTDENIKEIEDLFEAEYDNSYMYVRSFNNMYTTAPITDGLDAGKEIIPGFPTDYYETYSYKLIPVFEVEWIDIDEDHVMNRYEGIRVGNSVYILIGKSPDIVRSMSEPKKCTLSLNGLFFIDRSNKPYSLVLACAHLQDKYDLIMYFRDNVIANSGTRGDWIDISMLPTALGADLTERLQVFLANKKSGLGIIDTSQEGRAFNNNTTFAGYDDTLQASTIQAFDLALARIEEQMSGITGVFRERLNGIQQHDAVSNVKVGIQNSFTITKVYYQQIDNLICEILLDCLNLGKIVWKKGFKGVLILGDKLQKVFTALPEYYTVTDFDINIDASSKLMADLKNIQQVVFEFIKSGQLDADIIVDALTARSITELKQKISLAIAKRKEEGQSVAKLTQQLEQLQNELKKIQTENNKLKQQASQLETTKIQIEKEKLKNETELNWFKARNDAEFKQATVDNDSKRTEIELRQLYDGNLRNDLIKNI